MDDRVGMLLADHPTEGKMSDGGDGWKCFDQRREARQKRKHDSRL